MNVFIRLRLNNAPEMLLGILQKCLVRTVLELLLVSSDNYCWASWKFLGVSWELILDKPSWECLQNSSKNSWKNLRRVLFLSGGILEEIPGEITGVIYWGIIEKKNPEYILRGIPAGVSVKVPRGFLGWIHGEIAWAITSELITSRISRISKDVLGSVFRILPGGIAARICGRVSG